MRENGGIARVRLAELLAALSLGTDLGMGQPMEHVLRQCLIALQLADRLGLDAHDRAVVYYASLLVWVGCHIDAFEQAKWFGDDLTLKSDFRRVDFRGVHGPAFMLRHLGAGRPVGEKVRLGLGFPGDGRRVAESMLQNHATAAVDFAARIGLDETVRRCIEQAYERWDGKGVPHGARGEEIVATSRLITLADVVEVYQRIGGVDAAKEVARERRGTQFDPALVDLFVASADDLFADLDGVGAWDAIVDGEPQLGRSLSDGELDSVLEAVADYVDMKSPYTLGHSRAVAELAAGAAVIRGVPPADVALLRRAALVHDLGRLGVSNAIWDKAGELTPAEVERVRLHPYLTERMLAGSPALAPLGALAVQHHERLDGTGYPRGVAGDALTVGGRLLAAADAYRTKLEPRPHRAASTPEEAAASLRTAVREGRLDADAASAVLQAAGHETPRRQQWPAGLTTREVEVLRLLARGLSNKQVARHLGISPKTAGNHVEHIYTKIGVSNRPLAGLFASRHGLMAG